MIRFSTTALVLFFSTLPVQTFADVMRLKDGAKLEGSVRRSDDGWVVRTNTKIINVPADQVESIEPSTTTSPTASDAQERLASLRRSVENLSDLNQIIARFVRFTEQNSNLTATAQAKKDLQMWRDRLTLKMVKVNHRWVSPAERSELMDRAQSSIQTARQLMKQGRTKEAEPILSDALSVDPQNPSALFLTGILRYQQDEIPAARKAFDAVVVTVPDHAPSLNNLGIVQWRQRQYIASMTSFDSAMLASPVDKLILDNTAVALQSIPVEMRTSPIVTKALRHFQEQDQQLSEQMAREGFRRFGSLWASEKDIEQIKLQEKQIQDKLDLLSGDFDRVKDRVDQLNQNISDNLVQMHRIQAGSYAADVRTGAVVSLAYPPSYYDMQRDNDRMSRERDSDLSRMDVMKKQAQNLEGSKPSRRDVAVQRMFGAEETPLRIASTTQPAAN